MNKNTMGILLLIVGLIIGLVVGWLIFNGATSTGDAKGILKGTSTANGYCEGGEECTGLSMALCNSQPECYWIPDSTTR